MTEKLETIGAKTGLKKTDVRRLCRFGGLGILGALVMLFAAACASNRKCTVPANEPAREVAEETAVPQPGDPVPQAGVAKPAETPASGTNDGPWEGYPAGTRYGTVSTKDF